MPTYKRRTAETTLLTKGFRPRLPHYTETGEKTPCGPRPPTAAPERTSTGG